MTRGNKVLMCTSIGVALSAVDTTIVNVARDTIAKELNGSDGTVSWVLSGYSIVFAAVLLTSGRLADRYGRKRMYMTGLTIFILSSAACGFAWNLNILIAGRATQAVGAALLTPAALALVLPEFPMEKRSSALAVWGMVASSSAALGPPLGSVMI
ncbi:MAG: MFS transporter, partial [Actinomycetota bacterium]